MSFSAKQRASIGRHLPSRIRGVGKILYWRLASDRTKRALLASAFSSQAKRCDAFGSPLYGHLMRRAALDIARGGPTWMVLDGAPLAPVGADYFLPLRFMAGVHRLALEGRAPELAIRYRRVPGSAHHGIWPAFIDVVSEHVSELRGAMYRPVQTNEPGRSAALLGGFLVAGRGTGGRLRILELGASAGLNLRWDMFRYEAGKASWGNPQSPVQLRDFFLAGAPPMHLPATVVERAGCDLNPLDPQSEEDRLTLRSLVWPDQHDRMALLDAALHLAEQTPVQVDCADAAEWLAHQLDRKVPGVTTVVFHSLFDLYVDEATRSRLHEVLMSAARRATPEGPLAHLRMEWDQDDVHIDLTVWPPQRSRKARLATADSLGNNIRWLGNAAAGAIVR